jgi:hypothetical protein
MRKKCKKETNLLPFHTIKAASAGDVEAINAVLGHYEGYISLANIWGRFKYAVLAPFFFSIDDIEYNRRNIY